jgi:hypothetical protein
MKPIWNNVTDRPRAGRPRKTTPREDRLMSRRARQRPFSTAGVLHQTCILFHRCQNVYMELFYKYKNVTYKYIDQIKSYIPIILLYESCAYASATTHKTSTVDITSSPCSIWLVTWSFGVDYSHMETGPLVWWKSFFATPPNAKLPRSAPAVLNAVAVPVWIWAGPLSASSCEVYLHVDGQ